ncbi:hypothetical protein Clacol_000271 [Clathrus columnatus]|uniref:Malic acid transport protein n=1 Tax=Clathrus columnatus TaxID=1419009 RepID=A0AAV4ZY36_9AGAM|nr:hypothetical protein Clacol_000271 [Clathrus columnatus]
MKVSMPHALLTMGVSVVMLFIGLTLALMIMTIYLSRIIIEGFPTIDFIISSFIPLGPCGQGAYSFLIAGQNFQDAALGGGVLGSSSAGEVINLICLTAAFFVWCIGIWWLVMALVAIAHVRLKGHQIPFKLTFWGLVFPNAVQAIGTIQLSIALDARFFRVLGAIYGAVVIALWVVLAIPTMKQVLDGSIFHAPYLEDDLKEMAGVGIDGSSNGTMNGEAKRM